MTEYNWNERHIITFPEEILVLQRKIFMFITAKKKKQGVRYANKKKKKITAFNWPFWAVGNLLSS